MKKTIFAFAVLLAICLIIAACAKKEEVEPPAETIPEPEAAQEMAEEMIDTLVPDSMAVPDSAMVDSVAGEATGH